MGALSETYVDPSIAGNSGTGTTGDPYGDLQYALDTMTRDATNGDRINIKAGTDEVMGAILDISTYGSPTDSAPLCLQGYTSTAGDGGVGGIDLNGGAYRFAASNFVTFTDLHIHNNDGSTSLLNLQYGGYAIGCELSDTGSDGITFTSQGFVSACHFHDIAGYGVNIAVVGIVVMWSYFKNDGTRDFTAAIRLVSDNAGAHNNIISIDGSSVGIQAHGSNLQRIIGNSILSASGTGMGIKLQNGSDQTFVLGNVVEGFSGVGGVGISTTSGDNMGAYGMNAVFNCATEYDAGDANVNLGDNESLGVTPFDKSGSDTYANRATYFAPVDTGNIRGGAYPTALRLDKGAVQHADPAGGGGLLTHPGMTGGIRG